jgi:hypothetical protein
MQVIESNHGLLTNVEVLDLLIERKQQRLQHQQLNPTTDRQKIDFQHRLSIENKVSSFSFLLFLSFLFTFHRHCIIFKRIKYISFV